MIASHTKFKAIIASQTMFRLIIASRTILMFIIASRTVVDQRTNLNKNSYISIFDPT